MVDRIQFLSRLKEENDLSAVAVVIGIVVNIYDRTLILG